MKEKKLHQDDLNILELAWIYFKIYRTLLHYLYLLCVFVCGGGGRCIHMRVWMCTWTHVLSGQNRTSECLLNYQFGTVSFTALSPWTKIFYWIRSRLFGLCHLPCGLWKSIFFHVHCWGCRYTQTFLSSYVGSEDTNSPPLDFRGSTIPIKPSLQTHRTIILNTYFSLTFWFRRWQLHGRVLSW